MARTLSPRRKALTTAAAWAVGLALFFPILWIVVLSFKSEGDAIRTCLADAGVPLEPPADWNPDASQAETH